MSKFVRRSPVQTLTLNYSSTNVTTSAWVEVSAATTSSASGVELFNGSGASIQIATGGSGSESAVPYTLLPGGSGILIDLGFAKGVRIAVKAIDQTASNGLLVMNLFE